MRLDVTKAGADDPDSATDPYGLMLSAYRNADGSYVVVAINYGDKDEKINIDGIKAGLWKAYRTSDEEGENLRLAYNSRSLDSVSLPGRSVTTFVSAPGGK